MDDEAWSPPEEGLQVSSSKISNGQSDYGPRQRKRAQIPSDASKRFVEIVASRARHRHSDAQVLLDSILLDACNLLHASEAAIMLYDAKQQTVEILPIGTPRFPGRIVRLGEGVAGRVIRTGQPLVVDDYERWQGKISGDVHGPKIVSAVGVPLRSGPTPIGALTLHSTDPARRFTMADAQVLELFADVAMLALSHVSLYADLKGLNKQLERRVRKRTRELERSAEEIALKNEQLEELLGGITVAQNEERRRIAQDIHDGVMQTLTAVIFEIKALETSHSSVVLLTLGLGNVRELLHDLETELRSVIQGLQPASLPGGELIGAVQNEANRFESRYGVHCRVRIRGRRVALSEAVGGAAIRIVKEALTNVHLHSSAASVGVEVHFLKKSVRVMVRDDGHGFDPAQIDDSRPHLGITGMRHSAETVGGRFAFKSTPGEGTIVAAKLPISRPK